MNRRGVFVDALYFLVMIFAVGIGLVMAWMVLDETLTAIAGAPVEQAAKDLVTVPLSRMDTVWDWTFLVILIGVTVAIFITSYVVASNPVFFFIFLLCVSLFGVMAGYFANAYELIESDAQITAAASAFPITSFILEHYLYYVLLLVCAMVIVFFAKPSGATTL